MEKGINPPSRAHANHFGISIHKPGRFWFSNRVALSTQRKFPNGMKHEAVRNFYDNVRSAYVQEFDSWDLGRYLRYLEEGTSLLRLDAEMIHITGKGREYLIWRTQNGIAKRTL